MYRNVFSALVATSLYLGLLDYTQQANAQAVATGGGSVALADLRFTERTAGGKLQACELVYLIAYEDNIYRRGDPVALRGAITVIDAGEKKGIVLGLKITMFDMVQQQAKLAPIHYAFMSANGHSYAGQENAEGNNEEGGLLVAYDLLKVPELYGALLNGAVELNFNRNEGASDVTVPVNLFADHPDMRTNFGNCTAKVIDALRSRLER